MTTTEMIRICNDFGVKIYYVDSEVESEQHYILRDSSTGLFLSKLYEEGIHDIGTDVFIKHWILPDMYPEKT